MASRRRGVRILRARAMGTGYGGPGNPEDVAGLISSTGVTKDGSVRDAQQLRAVAAMRARAQGVFGRLTIGSRGRL